MPLLLLLLKLLAAAALVGGGALWGGRAILRALAGADPDRGSALLAGLGASSLLAVALHLLGITPGACPPLLLLAAGVLFRWKRQGRWEAEAVPGGGAMLLLLALLWGALLLPEPVGAYDAIALWLPRAKAILAARPFAEWGAFPNDSYPPMLPYLVAQVWTVTGANEYAAALPHLLIGLGAALSMAAALGRAIPGRRWAGTLLAAALCVSPLLAVPMSEFAGTADLPVLFLAGAGGLRVALWLREGRESDFAAGAVLLAAGGWVKLDGIVAAGLGCLILAALRFRAARTARLRHEPETHPRLWLLPLLLLALPAGWRLFAHTHGWTQGPTPQSFDQLRTALLPTLLPRLSLIASVPLRLVRGLHPLSAIAWLPVAFVSLAALHAPRRRAAEGLLLLLAAAHAVAVAVAYLIWPDPRVEEVEREIAVTVDRVFLLPLLFCILSGALVLLDLVRRAGTRRRRLLASAPLALAVLASFSALFPYAKRLRAEGIPPAAEILSPAIRFCQGTELQTTVRRRLSKPERPVLCLSDHLNARSHLVYLIYPEAMRFVKPGEEFEGTALAAVRDPLPDGTAWTEEPVRVRNAEGETVRIGFVERTSGRDGGGKALTTPGAADKVASPLPR